MSRLTSLFALALLATTPALAQQQVVGPPRPARPAPTEATSTPPVVPTTAPAPPAAPGVPGAPPQKVTNVIVYGSDSCPKSSNNEIVVCARRPEGERYRIPPALRHKKPIPAQGSWANNAEMLDDINRQQMVPGTCSVNGSAGQSGCTLKYLQQWYAERKQQKQDDADVAQTASGMSDATPIDTDPPR